MAIQVNRPQKQASPLGTLASIASIYSNIDDINKRKDLSNKNTSKANISSASNAAVGLSNIIDNPAVKKTASIGALFSGNIPAALGGAAVLQGNIQPKSPDLVDNPMARMLPKLQNDTNQKLEILRNAEMYLNSAPPEIRTMFGPPLFETMLNASKQFKAEGRIG